MEQGLAVIEVRDRSKYIGSSDAAAVVAMSRWKTPLQLWAEKTGTLPVEDISGKLQVELGVELEDFIARKFMKERPGKKVFKYLDDQGSPKTFYHPDFSFIGATPDRGIEGENAGLECKTASARKAKEYQHDEIPMEYIVQCWHQMIVMGWDMVYLAVLIGNEDFIIREITRDEVSLKNLLDKEVEFWTKFIEPKVMPMIVTKNDAEILNELFPDVQIEPVVDLGDEGARIVESIQGLTADLKSLEDQIEYQKNELKIKLQEHLSGIAGKFLVTWKPQSKTTIDAKRLKIEQPTIYDQYAQVSSFRVIRYGEIKGGK